MRQLLALGGAPTRVPTRFVVESTTGVRGLPRVGAGGVLPKSPLRLLKRRNRAAFDGRSSSERSPNGEIVRKPLYGGPWIGYLVRARTAKKGILA